MDLNGEALMNDAADISWSGGSATFNTLMKVVQMILTKTPEALFPDAWKLTVESILPWFIGAGAVLVNLFFLIGFLRQNTNLKENVTIESWIEGAIRVIVANSLILNGVGILEDFIGISTAATKFVVGKEVVQIVNPDFDAGTLLFYLFVGIIYFIASAVCGILILIVILKRVLYIDYCIAVMPIGIATFAGGRGFENSGIAWIKTFLTYCFEIVAIAFLLRVGSVMASGLPAFILDAANESGMFDGFWNGINNMVVMVFLTSVIKNADDLVRRSFDLR